jgi:ketosteroid isomerase-like protein
MSQRVRHVGLLAVVTGMACSKGVTQMDESHRTQIVQAVEQRMRSFEAAERALDAEKLVGHFAIGPDFYIYNDGQRLTYEIMTTAVRNTFPSLRSIEGGFIDLHVMALAPDTALATARFQETMTDGSGSQTIQHGAASWLWRHRVTHRGSSRTVGPTEI